MLDGRPASAGPAAPSGGVARYALAVLLTAAAVLSQYVLPQHVPALRPLYSALAGDLLVVYGIPIAAFATLVGTGPISRFFANPGKASVEGLRWYGLFSLLSLIVTVVLVVVYLAVDPSALQRLTAPNPDIQAAEGDPWFWVGFSFVIGLVEETIFRGWLFGFWVARRSPSWFLHAVWTSVLFAGLHLYYATTYGPALGVIFPTLVLLGLAFAVAYRYSGGNLLVIGLLHGAYDSAAFLYLVSPSSGDLFRFGLVAVGLAVAWAVYRQASLARGPVPVTLL